MTKDEKVLNDIVGAISVAFGCMAKYVETSQSNKNFNRRGLATSIIDITNALDQKLDNRQIIVTVLKNIAAELNDAPSQKSLLPFPKKP